MSVLRTLRKLARYNTWAHALLFDSLGKLPAGSLVALHGGSEAAMARGDMLLHVVNHKSYHRGYVAQVLYIAGHRPPTMDLPGFLRDAVVPG